MIKEGKALLEVDGVLYIVAEVRDGEMVPLPLEEVRPYVLEKREGGTSPFWIFVTVFAMTWTVIIASAFLKRL